MPISISESSVLVLLAREPPNTMPSIQGIEDNFFVTYSVNTTLSSSGIKP